VKIRKYLALALLMLMLGFSLLFGSILLIRLFYLSIILLVFSYLWTVLSVRSLNLNSAFPPEHLQVGDEFQREVTLTNNSHMPRLWLKLQDQTDLGHQDTAIISLSDRNSETWKTNFICDQRGLYHVGPVSVTATDPLGIFNKQIQLGEKQPVLIYPKTVDLPHFKFSSFSDFGYNSGSQSINRISPNASGIREFISGDSLHHMHWQSTLRTGKLMVKMFDADRSYNASKIGWILLDMNEDSHFGRGLETTDEQAITIAASVAQNYLQGGMRVGLIASDQKRSLVVPERGEPQLWQILETLALMKTDWKYTLNDAVTTNLNKLRDNPLVIIIATTTSAGLLETIHQLRNRVDSVVVILLDVASWKGTPVLSELGRTLALTGAQVYHVFKGDELTRALDSKASHLHLVGV